VGTSPLQQTESMRRVERPGT